jgi:AraC family transcriptional regulator
MIAPMIPFASKPMPHVGPLDSGDRSDSLRVVLRSGGPGVVEVPELEVPRIAIYVGRPVKLDCRHGVKSHSGLALHGDIDIIPEGVPSRWQMKQVDTALVLMVGQRLLAQAAEESGFEDHIEIRSRFRVRDSQIEHLGWALMAEAQQGYPSGCLYMDCMATALAVQLLRNHSSVPRMHSLPERGMARHKLRHVQSYIEENLRCDLSLDMIAAVAGMSKSHLKATFRTATGMPVHQYVIRRRVERAALLLREGRLPISQIAVEVGFAHQSHLAMHMKRLLGVSPRQAFRSAPCDLIQGMPYLCARIS